MKISIIVPSYNQPDFIEDTFQNLAALKLELYKVDVDLEILLFDSCSVEEVQCFIMIYSQPIIQTILTLKFNHFMLTS